MSSYVADPVKAGTVPLVPRFGGGNARSSAAQQQ
jgi:hypothetical protein